jgi:hypothetical protein
VRRSGASLRSRGILVAAKRRRLGSRALKPPRAKHRARPRDLSPGSRAPQAARDTGGPRVRLSRRLRLSAP